MKIASESWIIINIFFKKSWTITFKIFWNYSVYIEMIIWGFSIKLRKFTKSFNSFNLLIFHSIKSFNRSSFHNIILLRTSFWHLHVNNIFSKEYCCEITHSLIVFQCEKNNVTNRHKSGIIIKIIIKFMKKKLIFVFANAKPVETHE